MIHDDAFSDSIAALALGAVSDAEGAPLVEHIATCAACRAEYAELYATAGFVGYAAELAPGTLDEVTAQRLRSRVMRAVRDDAVPAAASASSAGTGRDGIVGGAHLRTPWLAYGAAAAAAVLAAVLFSDDAAQRSANDRNVAQIADLARRARAQSDIATRARSRARALDARVAQLVAPGSKHFGVAGGEVVASGHRVLVALRDLPALPKGKVYQAWTLAKGTKTVAPSVTFSPAAGGVTIVDVPGDAAKLQAVAVTVEPAGGSRKPTSKPRFMRPLS
ncbi:MAG: anti-sigma factor [Vulcanimicrobiaceae bacterium]